MITEEMIQKAIDLNGEKAEWYNIDDIVLVQAHAIVNECRLSIGEYPTLEEIEEVLNQMDLDWSHNSDTDTYFIKYVSPVKDQMHCLIKPLLISIIEENGVSKHGVVSLSYIDLKATLEKQIGEIFQSTFISNFVAEDNDFDMYFASTDTGSRYYVAIKDKTFT